MKFAVALLLASLVPPPSTRTTIQFQSTTLHSTMRPPTTRELPQPDSPLRSMIEQYALEERTKVVEHADGLKTGGEPSGKFWMNQASALAASKEVLATHKGLSGKMLDDYA